MRMPHVKLFKLAYWSRLWNLMASERVRLYSRKYAVEGDLVLAHRAGGGGADGRGGGGGEDGVSGKSVPMCPSYLSGFTNKRGGNVWRFGWHAGGEGGDVIGGDQAPDIHVVSAQEERERAFSIFEVVLPVVDGDVRCVLPRNGVGKFIRRLVKAEGMSDVLRGGDNATQRCGFRSLVVRPQELVHKLICYSDRDADLTHSMVSVDFNQTVGGGECGQQDRAGAGLDGNGGEGRETDGQGLGRWRALVMSFTLPPSSYATMMVREVCGPQPTLCMHAHAHTYTHPHACTHARMHACARTHTRSLTRLHIGNESLDAPKRSVSVAFAA